MSNSSDLLRDIAAALSPMSSVAPDSAELRSLLVRAQRALKSRIEPLTADERVRMRNAINEFANAALSESHDVIGLAQAEIESWLDRCQGKRDP